MTGYESKRAAAQDKLDNDDALTIAYQSGFYDGKKAAQRPWVGLTAEEIASIPLNEYVLQTVEKLLKEKNI